MTTNLYEWGYYPQAPTSAFDWESMLQDMEPIPTVTPAYPNFGELEHWGFAAQSPTAAFDWESAFQDMEQIPTVTPAYPFGELEDWGFVHAPTAAFDWESMFQDNMEPILDVMGRPNQPGYHIDPVESESESESETADWNMVRFVLTRA